MAAKELDISDIIKKEPDEHELLNLLADIDNKWFEIGLAFKIPHKILSGLKERQDSNIVKLSEVIYSWKTTTESKLVTWETVIATFEKGRIINNKTVANTIREYLTKAKEEDLERFLKTLSESLINPVEVSQHLFSERCIGEATLDKIEALESSLDEKKKTLLSVIRTKVCSDHKKLKALATVLSKFEETKDLSKTIFKEYILHDQPQEITLFDHTSQRHHASDILCCHYGALSQSLQYPISLARLLHGEQVISEDTSDSMETCKHPVALLLNAVRKAVHANSKNLKVFANVLRKSVDNIQLGDAIMKDYDQLFEDGNTPRYKSQVPPTTKVLALSPSNKSNAQTGIFVPRNMRRTFHSMRLEFGATFNKVRDAIKETSLTAEKLKSYILDCYPDLTPRLSHPTINTIDNILDIIKEKCTLIDICILEAIAKRFDIKEAETHIEDYKNAINEFCHTVSIGLCLQESLEVTKRSSLNCETAKFELEWDPDETSLADIENLLSATFERLRKIVKVDVVKGNSIIVICTFPFNLLGPLIAKAQETLEVLKKKGLVKLTIGYDIIYNKHQKHTDITAITEENTKEFKRQLEIQEMMALRDKQIEELKQKLIVYQQGQPTIYDGVAIESSEETKEESRYLPSDNYKLLIVGSYGKVSESIQVAYKCIPSDQVGSNECMKKEIDLIEEKHKRSRYCNNVSVYSELPQLPVEKQRSKDYYLEEIRRFLIECRCGKALIFYTGHGEKNTGNWCFIDGVITFQDMFKLYEDNFKGKLLTINSDCSYSSNWIKDCAKTLDDLNISSCGHHTRKAEILLNVWCSCDVEEEATALCYVNEAIRFDEDEQSVVTDFNTKLTSGQNTKLGDFRQIRCSKKTNEPCEVDSHHKLTWMERVFPKTNLIHLVRSRMWQYVLVDEEKLDDFKNQVNKGKVNVADYGRVLLSGWGQDPPPQTMRKLGLKCNLYN